MKINSKKSKEMVICFSSDDNVRHSIPSIVIDGNLVGTVEYAKLLGVTKSNDLTWNRHVDCFVRKAAKIVYKNQLKRTGISQLDMVIVYISVVRPVIEYACPVWHTNLHKYLSDNIELIRNFALKSIFQGKSYHDILNELGLITLMERREVLCLNYFTEIQGSARQLNCLLPSLRNIGLYRDVWIAAIASSTTSLATRTAAICVRFQGRRVRRV